MELILASGSPRRKEILEKNGIKFVVKKAEGQEYSEATDPAQYCMELSAQKATEIYEKEGTDFNGFILGADTIVVLDDKILGKPDSEADAFNMLKSLNGRSHSVFTGATIIRGQDGHMVLKSFNEETKVFIKSMSDQEIKEYIATKECMDKAGAYAIQGIFSKYIDKYEGDYDNVVGLCINKVLEQLDELGFQK